MTFDLAGNPIEAPTRQRARRAKPFDPYNLKTWHEVNDLQPRFKERLRLGAWVGWHVRKQGDVKEWGPRRQGIIEAVPAEAAWGVLDWCCIPGDRRESGLLWVELKSETGKLTPAQATHALRLARFGQEVAVLRPRHFVAGLGEYDLAFERLVNHKPRPSGWAAVLVTPDMLLSQVLKL